MVSSGVLRSQANRALMAGRLKKALELFVELHRLKPDDLRVRIKIAELLEKTGDVTGAVNEYIQIAKAYAEQGMAVQAIAIDKIIMRLDPSQTEIREQLKRLSEERGDDWAMTQSVEPGSFRTAGIPQPRPRITRTPLLSGLSGDELDAFIKSLRLRMLAEGEFVFRQGDPGDTLYLVGMGEILLEAADVSGKVRVFSRLGEGDFFGEVGFMSRSRHTHAARAGTDACVLMIDRATFDDWVAKFPSIRSVAEEFYKQRVLAQVLAITPVFEGIPDKARFELIRYFRLRTFADGECIVREGDIGDTFYLIRSGEVQVSVQDRKSRRQVMLGCMRAGDFFGEVALLTGRPRTATVCAKGTVELMELSRADFEKIVKDYPRIRSIVETYLKKRVRDTIRTLTSQHG